MNKLIRIILAFVFLMAALFCYSHGIASGTFAFVLLGIAFEAAFWLKLFPFKRKAT
jgi:hypothetical protein